MKNIIVFFLLVNNFLSYGQYYEKVLEPVLVQDSKTFYMASRLELGGTDRNSLLINLPKNTVEWYYIFSTYSNEANKPKLNLFNEIKERIKTEAKAKITFAIDIFDHVTRPNGANNTDIYLTNQEGYDEFFAKTDLGTWVYKKPSDSNYATEGSIESSPSGKLSIKKKYGAPLYLNFKNPSLRGKYFLQIEVVAIIAKEVYIDEWVTEGKNSVHATVLNSFLFNDHEVSTVCECVTSKIIGELKPSSFSNLSNDRLNGLLNEKKNICFKETNNEELGIKEKKAQQLLANANGYGISKDYNNAVKEYEELVLLGLNSPDIYNSLGWNCLLAHEFIKAKEYLSKGLQIDPHDFYLLGNLAHAFLLNNEYENAENLYLKHKKKRTGKLTWKKMVAKDFEDFEKSGINHDDFGKIRKLLNIRPPKQTIITTNFKANHKITFRKGRELIFGKVETVDNYKEKVTLSYLNIYGETKVLEKGMSDLTLITEEEYEEKLSNYKVEIEKYKYSIGEYATWQQQDKSKLGIIKKLDDKSHKASIEYLDIFGDKKITKIPYLQISIIEKAEYDSNLAVWQEEIRKYKFEIGEKVTWISSSIFSKEIIEGTIINLNERTHQADIKFTNKKGEEKIIKKGYLKLIKKQ